jgi:hypothetical protein
MTIKQLFIVGFLLITNILNAQRDFRSGYVISNSGDTLFGEIDYRSDLTMSNLCRFRSDVRTIIEYKPQDILAFRFTRSKFYVSKKIQGKHIFLEYLIQGKVNIYYMLDSNGPHYYIDKEGEMLTEIPYDDGIKYLDNKQMFYASTKHIGFLTYFMQDAPDIQYQINRIRRPEHDNLIHLARDYHNLVCKTEQCIIFEKPSPLIKLSVEPVVGLLKLKGYSSSLLETGGNVYFQIPRWSEKIYFKSGLIFNSGTMYNGSTNIDENLQIVKLPFQFLYMYQANSFRPKVSLGINFLTEKFEEIKSSGHTISLNTGFNYYVNNSISLSFNINSDYTPIYELLMNEDLKFDIISYSFNLGLYIDL